MQYILQTYMMQQHFILVKVMKAMVWSSLKLRPLHANVAEFHTNQTL